MDCVLNTFWLVSPRVYYCLCAVSEGALYRALWTCSSSSLILATCVYELMGGDVWIMFNSILHILSNSVFGNTQAENDSWILVLYLAIV